MKIGDTVLKQIDHGEYFIELTEGLQATLMKHW